MTDVDPDPIDANIDGQDRKLATVFCWNGFFYAIDRTNGQFVYAFPSSTASLDERT